jgi:Sulfotransferase family
MSKPYLCEKTPSNIVRSRFLQAVFPKSSFIFVSRHPAVYALAVLKWNHRVLLPTMIENWLACERTLKEDLPYLRRYLVLRYEEMSLHPERTCRDIEKLLELDPKMDTSLIKQGLNNPYISSWQAKDYRRGPNWWRTVAKRCLNEMEIAYIEWRYERAINAFGYSFHELA